MTIELGNLVEELTKGAKNKKLDVGRGFFKSLEMNIQNFHTPFSVKLPLVGGGSLNILQKGEDDNLSIEIVNGTDIHGERFSTPPFRRDQLGTNNGLPDWLEDTKYQGDEEKFLNFIANLDLARDVDFYPIRHNDSIMDLLSKLGIDTEKQIDLLQIKNGGFDDIEGKAIYEEMKRRERIDGEKMLGILIPENSHLRPIKLEVPREIIERFFKRYNVSSIYELQTRLQKNPPKEPLFTPEDEELIKKRNKELLKSGEFIPNHLF